MEVQSNLLLEEIIQVLKKQKTFNKEILSFSEAVEFLDVSASFLYKMTSEKAICHFIPNGKLIFFKKSDLISWLTKHKIDSVENIINPDNNTIPQR